MPNFTVEQNLAIYTKGCNLLVAAAAGSGKTAVLVERIIEMIIDKNEPIDIDKLLVVTFTELAAIEMRQRIEARLNDLLYSANLTQNETDNIKKQCTLLQKSNIMTIHAFCMQIVRENFHIVDLDPNFRIGEEAELSIIKQEVLEELLESEYTTSEKSFLDLVEIYSGKYKDNALRDLILKIHLFIVTSPWPENKILEYCEHFNIDTDTKLDDTLWAGIIRDYILSQIEGMEFDINYGKDLCFKENGPIKYMDNLNADLEILKLTRMGLTKNFEQLYQALEENSKSFTRMASYRKNEIVDEELKEEVKKIRDKVKKAFKELNSKIFYKSPDLMLNDISLMYKTLYPLSQLVIQFLHKYNAEKKERNLLDFNDLEQFSLKILLENTGSNNQIVPSSIAISMQKNFHEILVDEYQDSNLIQELILSAIAKNNNRFMVGDVKQSIYKFRQARPEIFIEKYDSFLPCDKTEQTSLSQKIDLSMNFRSREQVLAGINLIFYSLMSKDIGDVVYNETAALHYGANFVHTDKLVGGSVELHLIENKQEFEKPEDTEDVGAEETSELIEDLSKVELEAAIIAKRIKQLFSENHKQHVYDKSINDYREIEFRDIVILASSVKNIGNTFVEKFKRSDIPLYVNTSGGYFETLEVTTILSLLTIIDNPKQDIPMLTVLHSPIYSFNCDDLIEIRALNLKICFYDCLNLYVCQGQNKELIAKIELFLEQLNKFRKISVYTPISELLWLIYEETNYLNYVGLMVNEKVRKANLRALIERAISYETTSYKGLFHFIKYIEKIKNTNTELSEAKVVSGNENVVRMMTIHGSKGLEFPIVFVCMMGKEFNLTDLKNNLILHGDYGFGPTYTDLDYRVKCDTFAKIALKRKIHIETLSENLRVLYVAATRAKEKLIFTGVLNDFNKKLNKWLPVIISDKAQLPRYYIQSCKNYLDWIAPSILRSTGGISFLNNILPNTFHEKSFYQDADFEVFYHSYKESMEEELQISNEINELAETTYHIDIPECDLKDDIYRKLSWSYDRKELETLVSKISISEIKRNYYLERIKGSESSEFFSEKPIFSKPEFLKEKHELSSTDKGTAMHTIMEFIDFTIHRDHNSIVELINELVRLNLLTKDNAECISVNKIERFVNSDLADRIRKSDTIKREEPFVIGLSPYEVYLQEDFKHLTETILVHGIIDCYFIEDGEIVLIDYKSDFVSKESINKITEKYKVQLDIYKKALERATNMKVKQTLLYLFQLDDYTALG